MMRGFFGHQLAKRAKNGSFTKNFRKAPALLPGLLGSRLEVFDSVLGSEGAGRWNHQFCRLPEKSLFHHVACSIVFFTLPFLSDWKQFRLSLFE
jgi:hypothetical protein